VYQSRRLILDFHPDCPGRKLDKPLKFLGYWHSVSVMEDKFGVPLKTGIDFDRYQERVGSAMPLPHEWIDKSWNEAERQAVLAYLRVQPAWEHWRGYSWCRFDGCDNRRLGTTDRSDGTYVWPEGFAHYIEKHGVKPPDEFIRHVLRHT
jgi:hypothetical protein